MITNDPKRPGQQHDLTEEASKRGDGYATEASRLEESDDAHEMAGIGRVDTNDGDDYGENKVSTSLDDEEGV
ncbi:MAG TPA: hypothetical protein VHK91_02430 [Flavisolibacter sp.]|jgi:hypothetical protein|nr:hypothetical protein [Flavisolibacter sp.]